MMKLFILLFLLIYSQTIFSQKEKTSLNFPEFNVIYAGYDVLIKTKYKLKKMNLSCEGCDTLKKINSTNWIIKASKSLQINLLLTNKKSKEIERKTIQVIQIPKPTLFLDSVSAETLLTKIPQSFQLILNKSIPLKIGFVVEKWMIDINGKVFVGTGTNLNETVKNQLNEEKKGFLKLTVFYFNPEGRTTTTEIFQFELK